ncbi:MAG: MBL fold metallo-hydrolase [Gemmatimonadota bacterium]
MAVVFRDFVTVVEAPEVHPGLESIPAGGTEGAGGPTRRPRQVVDSLVPGKPIRFLIVSHHHSDHLGGIGGLAGFGTTVLAPAGDLTAVRLTLGAPPPGRAGTTARDGAVEGVARRRVITDGERVLEVWNVGRNPHTAENLFVWLPSERIAFQGDLFYYEVGGPFPPSGRGRMNRFFAGWPARHRMEPKAVYGVHSNGAAGREALRRARS